MRNTFDNYLVIDPFVWLLPTSRWITPEFSSFGFIQKANTWSSSPRRICYILTSSHHTDICKSHMCQHFHTYLIYMTNTASQNNTIGFLDVNILFILSWYQGNGTQLFFGFSTLLRCQDGFAHIPAAVPLEYPGSDVNDGLSLGEVGGRNPAFTSWSL